MCVLRVYPMMMMIAPNSCPSEGCTHGEEEELEVEEREYRQELRRQARTLPQVQLGQGCRLRGRGENMDVGVGFHSTGGADGARDQSYLLTIGMERATEK